MMNHIMYGIILLSVTMSLLALPEAHADSPHTQFQSGISLEDIQCTNEKTLLESPRGTPACVKESSVERLVQRGFVLVSQTTDKAKPTGKSPPVMTPSDTQLPSKTHVTAKSNVQESILENTQKISDDANISSSKDDSRKYELNFVDGSSVTIMTDKQLYDIGELVKIRIINTGTATLQFPNTSYGWWISDINNTDVYHPPGAAAEVKFHPRQHTDAIWNQHTFNHHNFYSHDPVPAGVYKIHMTGFPDRTANITIIKMDDLPNIVSMGNTINDAEQLDFQTLQTTSAINRFAVDFYKYVSNVNENVFFSPFSMYVTLSALYDEAGQDITKNRLSVSEFEQYTVENHTPLEYFISDRSGDDSNVVLKTARNVWIADEINPYKAHLEIIEDIYPTHRSTRSLDDRVDSWIVNKTNYKELDTINLPKDSLFVTDLAYFNGIWMTPLPALDYPLRDPFWTNTDKNMDTDFLTAHSIFDYAKINGTKILRIPYDNDHLSMIIILPDGRNGLELLEESMTVEMIEKWQNNLNPKNVFIVIPMLNSINGDYVLSDFMRYLRAQDTFDLGAANFLNSTNSEFNKNLHPKIFHKTLLDTPREIVTTNIPSLTPDAEININGSEEVFIADHPFMFIIQNDATRTILFMGKFITPL